MPNPISFNNALWSIGTQNQGGDGDPSSVFSRLGYTGPITRDPGDAANSWMSTNMPAIMQQLGPQVVQMMRSRPDTAGMFNGMPDAQVLQYLQSNGIPINEAAQSGGGFSQIMDLAKVIGPIALAAAGASYLGPAAGQVGAAEASQMSIPELISQAPQFSTIPGTVEPFASSLSGASVLAPGALETTAALGLNDAGVAAQAFGGDSSSSFNLPSSGLDLSGTFGPSLFSPNSGLGLNSDIVSQNAFNPGSFTSGVSLPDTSGGGILDWYKKNKDIFQLAGGALNIGSGLIGLNQSSKIPGLIKDATAAAQDPNIGNYRTQLAALMANPASVTSMPGYQFGLDQARQAILRKGAASGSGGNEAIALAQFTPAYAQNFYQQQFNNLAQLSQGSPAAGSLMLQGTQLQNDMLSRSLASLGFGVGRLGGQSDLSTLLQTLGIGK